MKITIEGTPKEIASLVLELQERRADDYKAEPAKCDVDNFTEKVIRHLQEQPGLALRAISP